MLVSTNSFIDSSLVPPHTGRMRLRVFLFSIIAGAVSVLSASAAPKLTVVTTTSMLTDLVRSVGGDRVEVQGLMGPGVDPHLYKATAGDVARLQRAKLVIYHGLMLEGQMSELLGRVAQGGRRVVAVGDSIPAERLLRPDATTAHHPDPHIWGDAELWSLCIDPVTKALSEADPEGAKEYAARAESHRAELLKLHAWAKERAQGLPTSQRILITSHDAFNYLGRAYGFQVVGVQGISTVSEAGLADIVKVTDFIKQKGVKAVFVESSVPHAAIERISKDSGAKVGGELFSDAVGTPGKLHTVNGETYDEGTVVGMLKHNINTVVEALK
jgi:manganese/zinc/iron transport system substrate-binding protein